MIDLGEASWSETDIAQRRLPWSRWRQIVVGMLVAVLLFALAGSLVRGTVGLTTRLWSTTGSGFVLGDGRMYVFDDRGEVRAYLTRTGVDLWQVQLSGTIRDVWDLGGGRLAIGGLFVLEPGGGLEAAVVLLDAATGTEVATVLGTLMALAPQGSAAVLTSPGGGVECDESVGCVDVFAIDPRTGARLWRLPGHPHSEPIWEAAGLRGRGFGLVDEDGVLRVHDHATGTIRREFTPSTWGDEHPLWVLRSGQLFFVHGGLLRVARQFRQLPPPADPGRWVGTDIADVSFHSITGAGSWKTTITVGDQGSNPVLRARSCGKWICVFGPTTTVLMDASTGEALRAFSAEVLGLPTVGLIAARGETDASADEVRFLNPVTGDHGGALRGVVGLIDGGWRYELVHATSVSGDRTDVARVGRDGKVEVLGTIDRALACAATDGVLVCTHPVNPNLAENRDYTVGVWSLPSGVG